MTELTETQKEVFRTLTRAVDQAFPERYLDEKQAASKTLLKEFLSLAEATGLEDQKEQGYILFGRKGFGFVRIGIDGHSGAPWISHHETRTVTMPRLTYDVLTKQWVGMDVDTSIAPEPGKRLPRKDALLVLAETVVEVLAK